MDEIKIPVNVEYKVTGGEQASKTLDDVKTKSKEGTTEFGTQNTAMGKFWSNMKKGASEGAKQLMSFNGLLGALALGSLAGIAMKVLQIFLKFEAVQKIISNITDAIGLTSNAFDKETKLIERQNEVINTSIDYQYNLAKAKGLTNEQELAWIQKIEGIHIQQAQDEIDRLKKEDLIKKITWKSWVIAAVFNANAGAAANATANMVKSESDKAYSDETIGLINKQEDAIKKSQNIIAVTTITTHGKTDAELIKNAEEVQKKFEAMVAIGQKREAEIMKKAYEDGIKRREDYDKFISNIITSAFDKADQAQIDHNNKMYGYNILQKERGLITETEFLDNQYKLDIEAAERAGRETYSITAKYEEDKKQLKINKAVEILNEIDKFQKLAADLASALYDRQLNDFENAKNAELLAAGDNEKLKEQINIKYAAKEAEVKTKQAKMDKASALFSIGLQTAMGIMKAMSEFFITGGLPWTVIIGAAGALQAAAVLAKPIPKFATGTQNAPAGMAMVGEQGPEMVQFGGGEKVYTNSQTKNMMGGISKEMADYIIAGINNKLVYIDETGSYKALQLGRKVEMQTERFKK